jgi:cyclopropane-fatty-acyl-phospholipid synthase
MRGPMRAGDSDSAIAIGPVERRSFRQGVEAAAVQRWLSAWRVGTLMVELPDRSTWTFGDVRSSRRVTLSVRDWRFFSRVVAHSDVGLGESYMAGEWRCDDLVGFLRLLLEHRSIARRAGLLSWIARLAPSARRHRAPRSPGQALEDVRVHYDLGNEFFALFLDDSMTYSTGIFATPATTLAEAQHEKLDRICRRLALAPGLDVLDIGGGWGSFAIHAAASYGCRVRSITLSPAQQALARERVRAAGLDALVDVRLCDYRDVGGRFDRVVSIEMLEAIGFEQWESFFRACDRLLAAGGRMFLQTSTYPDGDFDAYRNGGDWIRAHVFPGGLLASLREIRAVLEHETALRLASLERVGPHYVETLRCWRERYLQNLPAIRRLGFDGPFRRKWDLYLAMCEAAFAVGRLDTLQLVLDRTGTPLATSS